MHDPVHGYDSGPTLDVTVIVPTQSGGTSLSSCLWSLARQTLAPEHFEVVVVRTGSTACREWTADLRRQFPDVRIRQVQLCDADTNQALNVGLHAARGAYVTFVTDHDFVAPQFLQTLLELSRPGLVGVVAVETTGADQPAPQPGQEFRTSDDRACRPLERSRDTVVPPEQLPGALLDLAGKMLSTDVARSVRFDPDLGTGAAAEFWVRVLRAAPFSLHLCGADKGALYRRAEFRCDEPSAAAAYQREVDDRLATIARLEATVAKSQSVRTVIPRLIDASTMMVNRFLQAQPERHREAIMGIRRRGLTNIRFDLLNRGVARHLAILYVALPYADTSALVAARRIREAQVLVDVLSSDMSSLRGRDEQAWVIWQEFVDQVSETATAPTPAWWPGINAFCHAGLEQIEAWEDRKGAYRSVYSRAMWPAAHLLAALYKLRHPETPWLAEFSDPLRYGTRSEQRLSTGDPDPGLMEELSSGLVQRGFTPPEGDNLYQWIEALVYALADTILFTNEHQRSYMLGYCEDPALTSRALAHSEVEAHPTLPKEFYALAESSYPLDPNLVNVAYFGVFYATRGLSEVVGALQSLSPAVRAKLRLHVFTANPKALRQEMGAAGLDDVVVANEYVSYVEFLRLTTLFDALLVNDARTAESHSLNPYLPSKWSDYAGSGTPIWGVVERGSVLSTRPLAYRSVLGDIDSARAVLEKLVALGSRRERERSAEAMV
ncbi:MAG TPA: glycosyltransferase [Propionibacteriaceae bacterium]|nr:glycosyltransferase [Propionibacteriaceae bacterium]